MVVIGSSFISMEIVAACAKRKLASIDVIGMEEYPFEAVLDKGLWVILDELCERCIKSTFRGNLSTK